MRKIKFAFRSLATVVFLAMLFSPPLRHVSAQKSGDGDGSGGRLTYPATKKVDVVDDYFGTKVPDPYRWLENNDSPEVAAWVEAENKVTFAYLDKIPYRNQLKDRLTKLLNYPKYTSPSRRGRPGARAPVRAQVPSARASRARRRRRDRPAAVPPLPAGKAGRDLRARVAP